MFQTINRTLLTQTDPKQTQTDPNSSTSSDLRKLVGLLTCWLVGLLACWLDLGAKKKALILTNRGLLNFMNRICIEKCNIISLFRCKFNHSFCFQQIFFEKKCVKRQDGQFFSEIHQFTERIHYLCIAKNLSIVPLRFCFEIFGIFFGGGTVFWYGYCNINNDKWRNASSYILFWR